MTVTEGSHPAPSLRIAVERGVVDFERRALIAPDEVVPLRPLELKLLRYLMQRPGCVVPGAELLREVWGYAEGVRTRTLYATVNRLRRKLERVPSMPRHLLTAPRQGYCFEPLRVARARLPLEADHFVGRKEELARLLALLASPAARVVTVRGPVGVGKSRLVQHVAWTARSDFNALLWDFCGCRTGQAARLRLERALGLVTRSTEGPRAARSRLAGAVRRTGTKLIIADGVEANAPSVVEEVARFADELSDIALVATSTGPLRVRGELELAIQPLKRSDAEELLFARCSEWDIPTPSNEEDKGELLEMASGLPMVIEILSRCAATVRPRAMRESGWPIRSSGGFAGAFRLGLEHAWRRAPTELQALLTDLRVFQGSFEPMRAAEALQPGEQDRCLDGLFRLAEESWLVSHSTGRLAILSTHAAFIDEVAPLGEDRRAELLCGLARSFAQEAYLSQDDPLGVRQRSSSTTTPDDIADLEACLRREVDDGDVEVAAACAIMLTQTVVFHGPLQVCVPHLQRVLDRVLDQATRIRLLYLLGTAYRKLGELDPAKDCHLRAIRACKSEDDPFRPAAVQALGVAEMYLGDKTRAAALFEEALHLHRESGSRFGAAVCVAEIGTLDYLEGRLEAACSRLQGAVDELEELGAEVPTAIYLGNLASAELELGQLASAEIHYLDALRRHERHGSRAFESLAHGNLALVAAARGDVETARERNLRALALAEEVGEPKAVGHAHLNLARLALCDNDARCRAHLERGLRVARRCGLRDLESELLSTEAKHLLRIGEGSAAQGLPPQ